MKLKFFNILKTLTLIAAAINMISCGGDSNKESASTGSQEVWTFPEHIRSMSESYKETSSAESQATKPSII